MELVDSSNSTSRSRSQDEVLLLRKNFINRRSRVLDVIKVCNNVYLVFSSGKCNRKFWKRKFLLLFFVPCLLFLVCCSLFVVPCFLFVTSTAFQCKCLLLFEFDAAISGSFEIGY